VGTILQSLATFTDCALVHLPVEDADEKEKAAANVEMVASTMGIGATLDAVILSKSPPGYVAAAVMLGVDVAGTLTAMGLGKFIYSLSC